LMKGMENDWFSLERAKKRSSSPPFPNH
jgi:hypothetical protein